ncbi:MAG TPA: hypothetical protein ENK16_03625 [Chromatiales bacterium]|nr:hypothetical protein [Chromatiales bacterium]
MRVTDHRYAGELDKFDLAVRMIRHEARTGTIRACTGFTEDRVRKLVASYFERSGKQAVRRQRGKSPRQISRFVGNARRQAEATLLASLFIYCEAARLDQHGECTRATDTSPVQLGNRLCQAFETYLVVRASPQLSFEWAWSLYNAMVDSRELYFAWCSVCDAPYIQDRYALDYQRCPGCETVSSSAD